MSSQRKPKPNDPPEAVAEVAKDRRKHNTLVQFVIDMHGSESRTSWMRWMGTFVITNIMVMWSLACIFDSDRKITFTLEDMPINLAGVIVGIVLGKVGQSYVEKKAAEQQEPTG